MNHNISIDSTEYPFNDISSPGYYFSGSEFNEKSGNNIPTIIMSDVVSPPTPPIPPPIPPPTPPIKYNHFDWVLLGLLFLFVLVFIR